MLPSLVAIAQGIENPECVNETVVEFSEEDGENITRYELVPYIRDPRFSPEWFFVILLAMVLLSWFAFILLDKLPFCQQAKVSIAFLFIIYTHICNIYVYGPSCDAQRRYILVASWMTGVAKNKSVALK